MFFVLNETSMKKTASLKNGYFQILVVYQILVTNFSCNSGVECLYSRSAFIREQVYLDKELDDGKTPVDLAAMLQY
jgi:hypothetical protein